MQEITMTKGDAGPTLQFNLKQNGIAVNLSGASVVATFRMRKIGASTNVYSATCTSLTSNGELQVPFTTVPLATVGEYQAEIYITGLAGGAQTTEKFVIKVRDSLV